MYHFEISLCSSKGILCDSHLIYCADDRLRCDKKRGTEIETERWQRERQSLKMRQLAGKFSSLSARNAKDRYLVVQLFSTHFALRFLISSRSTLEIKVPRHAYSLLRLSRWCFVRWKIRRFARRGVLRLWVKEIISLMRNEWNVQS